MPSKTINPDGTPHIHTYIRAKRKDGTKNPLLYRCADPDCTHSMNKFDIEGKRSLCSHCQETEIILTPTVLKLSRPLCLNCSNTKEAKAFREKKRILQEIGIE